MALTDIFQKLSNIFGLEKKYELVKEPGQELYRIRALRDFRGVEKGDLGGLVASKKSLSQSGRCWIFSDAKVLENARVQDDAIVANRAVIRGNAKIIDDSMVHGDAIVKGNAIIEGEAIVCDHVVIKGNVRIKTMHTGSAEIYDGVVVKVSRDCFSP